MPSDPDNKASAVVTFTRPFDGHVLEAEIGPQTTGEQALQGMIEAAFLSALGRSNERFVLTVSRTGRELSLRTSLRSQGVRDGDSLRVWIEVGSS